MVTIAEIVGIVIVAVALINTFLQVMSCLKDEDYCATLWTRITAMVSYLPVAAVAPAPAPVTNNNQTYYYRNSFPEGTHVTFNLGNGLAAESVDQIPGYRLARTAHRVAADLPQIQGSRPRQIANQANPDADPSDW